MKIDFDMIVTDYPEFPNWKRGRGEPDKVIGGYACYWLWKDIRILTLKKFFADDQIEIIDIGEDWEKRGFAKRWFNKLEGAYGWWWRFENEIMQNINHGKKI
jgi:hypothetical protein